MPELINIASGKEPRPLQLDRFAGAFSVAGEKQEKDGRRKDTGIARAILGQS
jgi:hypothetical protein